VESLQECVHKIVSLVQQTISTTKIFSFTADTYVSKACPASSLPEDFLHIALVHHSSCDYL